jgi:hypothetical protein
MDSNPAPPNANAETSMPSAKRLNAQIAKWIAILQENFRTEISSELAEIYMEALRDLSLEELIRGCSLAIRTCEYFPKVAEIIKLGRPAAEDRATLEAEKAWDKYLERLHTYSAEEGAEQPVCYGGKLHYPPPLDPITDAAVRQCGGRLGIERTKPEDLHFVRERFIEAHVRFRITDGYEHLPSSIGELPKELQAAITDVLKLTDGKSSEGTR